MTTTPLLTDRLKELEKAATKGPWEQDQTDKHYISGWLGPTSSFSLATTHINNRESNAEFIAATRNSLTTLLEIIACQKGALQIILNKDFPGSETAHDVAQNALARVEKLEKKCQE